MGFTFFISNIINKKETIASVPFEVRNELYYQDIIDEYDYFSTYGRNNSTGSIIDNPTDTDSLFDKYVTYERLDRLDSVEIHMGNTINLEFLDKCPNVKTIYISDAEMLTDDDIEYINNSNIEHVYLTFNYEHVSKIKENKFDVSRITKDVRINNCFYSFTNDLRQLTIYNYLVNCDKELYVDENSYNHVKEIDEYLNQVIDEYKINEGQDDLEKVLLISNYICNNIDYDKGISKKVDEYLEELNNNKTSYFLSDTKTREYNFHSITSVINQKNKVKQGVCINYASLFDIMCYKVGIKSRIVCGINKTEHLGHAWNIVYSNDEIKCVDLTYYDAIEYGPEFLEQYYKTRDTMTYDIVTNYLIRDIDKDYANYNLYDDIETLDKNNEKLNTYIVNENLDKFPVLNDDIDLKNFLILFILGGSAGVIVDIAKKNKKEKILKQ